MHSNILTFLCLLAPFAQSHPQPEQAVLRGGIQHDVDANKNQLLPLVFTPLKLGSIKPAGWMKDQLTLMSNGLAGHMHDFYSFVADSSWLGGGSEYSALNEAFPYWFNGLVPLAYSLDDARLKEQVHVTTAYVLEHQGSDGWIGPEKGTMRNFWARTPVLLGFMQLVEANSTYEKSIVDAMYRYVSLMHSMLQDDYRGYKYHDGDEFGAGDVHWGRVRSQDLMLPLQWLYENYPKDQQDVLIDCMRLLYQGNLNWADWYVEGVYIKGDLNEVDDSVTAPYFYFEHGVNIAQGLKAPAVFRRFNHNESLIQAAYTAFNWTFTYHGAASGTVLADERIGGLAPYYGSELCTAVEAMYSLNYLYQAIGNKAYADMSELTAFNALPVMVTGDWWAHQYVAQPNQGYSKKLDAVPFHDTNEWSQTFGLEPDYPCCTVNHPQGYPKYLANSFLGVGKNGLAHALLIPATVTATLKEANVTISCDTNYPFDDLLQYTISSSGKFDFYVRVPSWYLPKNSTVQVGVGDAQALSPDSETGLHKMSIEAGVTKVTYTLGADIRIDARANSTVSVYYGSLLYALEIQSENSSTLPKSFSTNAEFPEDYAPAQSRDWIITNTSAWGVAIDPSSIKLHNSADQNASLPNPLWTPGVSPNWMTVQACEINWPLFQGVPGPVPAPSARKCLNDVFEARLVPYGTAKLHMAELPTVSLELLQ